jgi:hypothetical protein
MAKMAVSIVGLALSLYLAWFIKLGDYTLREHLVRISQTSEVHELGEGIASTLGSAKTRVKSQIAARLQATRWAADPDAQPEDSE